MKKSISIPFFSSRNEKINLDLIIFNSKWKIQSRFGFLHLEMKKSTSVEIFSIRNQKIMFDMNFFFRNVKINLEWNFFISKRKKSLSNSIFFSQFFSNIEKFSSNCEKNSFFRNFIFYFEKSIFFSFTTLLIRVFFYSKRMKTCFWDHL